jgi:probable rRNA maturation factor
MSHPDFPLPPSDESLEEHAVIQFFSEDLDSFALANENAIADWLADAIAKEGKSLIALSFIFCSDDYLHSLNLDYLKHDTLTDVITFPYREGSEIEGDIFISVDRVRENAVLFQTDFLRELYRVMIHGVLHLCGYRDKTPEEEQVMREKENNYLQDV